jgi:hypothetical protein
VRSTWWAFTAAGAGWRRTFAGSDRLSRWSSQFEATLVPGNVMLSTTATIFVIEKSPPLRCCRLGLAEHGCEPQHRAPAKQGTTLDPQRVRARPTAAVLSATW